ncbi:hypothetical protein L6261_03630 [Candidatus Parcubacteria bacterium]|nr:hypothetical protein [Candidatus Parcubacteria bacterium]
MTPEQIYEKLTKKRQLLTDIRNDLNDNLGKHRIKLISHRREFFKTIAVISIAVLGLSPVLIDKINIISYFILSIFIYLVLIILILSFLREQIDKEDTEIRNEQDKYNIILENSIKILDKYIETENYTEEALHKCFKEEKEAESIKIIKKENEELSFQRKNRSLERLEYTGEFFIFLFASATIFMLASIILSIELNIFVVICVLILIFGVTFSDSCLKIIELISKFVFFLKKKRLKRK